MVVPTDVRDQEQMNRLAERTIEVFGGIDVWVNNAGVIERDETDFVSDDVEDCWRVVETNVRGPMLVAHAVLPSMLARGEGRLLQVNSGSGYNLQTSYTGYGISKGALGRLTALLDAQYRDRGIRTLDLAPGVVATDMTAAMPVHADRTAWTSLEDVVALVRAFGDGELDALSGRFVRAGADTVESLRARAEEIVRQDARRLRVPAYGADDPLA